MKRGVTLIVLIAGALGTQLLGQAPQKKAAANSSGAEMAAGKHYTLPATPETVQWGWLDPNEKPKLTVKSGDTISIETMMHSMDQIKPGVPMDEIVRLRLANPGGGPHSVTGPIYVEGAEPGDTMEIRILKIVPKPDAVNFHLPGSKFPTVGLQGHENRLAARGNKNALDFFGV
ncbi:MAG TPA: acetamidase/formamidase family protein [Candidatus Acidoferrales bacterium]|nr:acetamidase/formamidase family protein [Candidatus Acidoferrales bacterium]